MGGALIAACVLASTTLLAACSDEGSPATLTTTKSEAPAKGSAVPPAPEPVGAVPATATATGPQITFANLTHDFGEITDTDKYRTSFDFTNTGSERLVIREVKAACGCTVPTLAKTEYAPGEKGKIDIVFDPKGKQDETLKYISVYTNAPEDVVKLTLRSDIHPLLKFERFFRIGEMTMHEEHRHRLPVFYTDPDLRINRIEVRDTNGVHGHITAKVAEMGEVESTSDDGLTTYKGEIEITVPADNPWGLLYGTRVNMDVYGRPRPDADPVSYTYDAFLSGSVYGELRADEPMISLSTLEPNKSYEKYYTIRRRTGQPFNVLSAIVTETSLPGVQVRVEPAGSAGQSIVVSGNTGGFHGSFKGMLAVETDVPGEESLTIPFAGRVP